MANEATLHPEIDGILSRWSPPLTLVPECDVCEGDMAPGDAVTLGDSLVRCPSCAWEEATHSLGALLIPEWTPVSVRELEHARAALAILLVTVDARIAEARHG